MNAILKSNGKTGIVGYKGMFYFIKNKTVTGSCSAIPSTFTANISFELPEDMDIAIENHKNYISKLSIEKNEANEKMKLAIENESKEKFHGKKLRVFENERITKCDKKVLGSFKIVADSYYVGSVTVTDSCKRGRHFDYSEKTYDGVFYSIKGEIYQNGSLLVSSRKKNYCTAYREISFGEFKKEARKIYLNSLNQNLISEIKKFNTELTNYALNYISKL